MGLRVIHDTNLYDYPDYNGAYERSKAAAAQYLAQYPTLQMVLDVHRDALVGADGTVYKPVLQIDGVKTAQSCFWWAVTMQGQCSRTGQSTWPWPWNCSSR